MQQPLEPLVEQEAIPTTEIGFDAYDVAGRYSSVPPADTCQQLQNLLQAYATYTDFGHRTELAGLFTPDAIWDGTIHGFGRAEGAEQIAALVTAHFQPANPMMHLAGPSVLTTTDDADVVHGACWCMATRWVDGDVQPTLYFYYDDVFRRTDDGVWRFAQRRLRPR